MATTVLRQGLTTYPTTVAGGTTPPDNLIIDVSKWAEALEPRKTPLLTKIGIGEPVNLRPHRWGQSRRMAMESTLAANINNAATSITVATSEGVLFHKWHVLEIIDYQPGSNTALDESTKEIVLVTADPNGDTLTVARGQGGTTAQAHSQGAKVFIIGSAEPELSEHTIGAVARGDQQFNYFQRFFDGVKADKAARNMPTWEHRTDPMLADLKEKQLELKLQLELAIWRGGRQQGDANPAGATPAMMGGIDTFIVTNVTNMAGAKLTPRVLEAELRDLAKSVDGGPEGLTLLMSYDTAAIFDSMLDPIRVAQAGETELTMHVEKVRYRFGTFDIMVSHNCRNGVIYGVRLENMKVRPFKGLNWHMTRKLGEQHGRDYDEIFISGDFTLEVVREAEMFKLHGFAEDIAQYDSLWQ